MKSLEGVKCSLKAAVVLFFSTPLISALLGCVLNEQPREMQFWIHAAQPLPLQHPSLSPRDLAERDLAASRHWLMFSSHPIM